jgi:transcriptional regulator with XRE-family HTH domain
MKPIYLSVKQKETGENIRRLLKSNGYTVKDVQEVMGFENPQAVYKWLSGKSLPNLENLLILSKLLNISIENILVIDEDINILQSINTQWMLNWINYVLLLQNGICNYRIR